MFLRQRDLINIRVKMAVEDLFKQLLLENRRLLRRTTHNRIKIDSRNNMTQTGLTHYGPKKVMHGRREDSEWRTPITRGDTPRNSR